MTLGLVNALEPAGADVARVVDQYVDPTEAGAGRGHHRLRRAWFGEVSGHHVGLAALLSDPVRQLVEGSLTATHQREPRCVLGEAQREGLSDAASGPVIRIEAFFRSISSPSRIGEWARPATPPARVGARQEWGSHRSRAPRALAGRVWASRRGSHSSQGRGACSYSSPSPPPRQLPADAWRVRVSRRECQRAGVGSGRAAGACDAPAFAAAECGRGRYCQPVCRPLGFSYAEPRSPRRHRRRWPGYPSEPRQRG